MDICQRLNTFLIYSLQFLEIELCYKLIKVENLRIKKAGARYCYNFNVEMCLGGRVVWSATFDSHMDQEDCGSNLGVAKNFLSSVSHGIVHSCELHRG